jgi:hypothetical protein
MALSFLHGEFSWWRETVFSLTIVIIGSMMTLLSCRGGAHGLIRQRFRSLIHLLWIVGTSGGKRTDNYVFVLHHGGQRLSSDMKDIISEGQYCPRTRRIMKFWAKNQGQFPNVARFASKILCIMPALQLEAIMQRILDANCATLGNCPWFLAQNFIILLVRGALLSFEKIVLLSEDNIVLLKLCPSCPRTILSLRFIILLFLHRKFLVLVLCT